MIYLQFAHLDGLIPATTDDVHHGIGVNYVYTMFTLTVNIPEMTAFSTLV